VVSAVAEHAATAARVAGAAALALSTTLAAAGCVRRADFVPPPAPAPLHPERAATAEPLPAGELTAEEAVRLALARNPDLRMAAARVAAARARLREAEAALWPRLSAGVTYLAGDAPSAFLFSRIDARALPAGVDFNDPGSFTNLEGGLTLRWNLWNAGRDLLGTWAADAAAAAAADAGRALANALVATVVGAYLDGRAAGELLEADDASIRSVAAQVEETSVKVEGGGALRADLLSLEVRLAEARQQRVRSDVARRLALASLRELLALPPEAPLVLAGAAYGPVPPPETAAEALAEAYRRRPEVQAARRAVERAGIELGAARRAYLPRLDLETRLYGDDAGADLDFGDRNWTVALALSLDLFDGFARESRIARARAALDEVTWADRQTLLQVARDVETAYLRLEEARARHAVAAQAVGAAEETLELVAERWRGGAETVTRYLEAEADRTRARTSEIRARLDAERAGVEVARAIGRLGEPGEDGAAGGAPPRERVLPAAGGPRSPARAEASP
jgi:outer membrane protein